MFKTITIEGQDQVGKADATSALVESLKAQGKQTTQITYPYYALPIGSTIRQFLKDINRMRGIDSIKTSLGQPREIEILGVLFAMNRLETVSTIVNTFDGVDDGYLISDRGPYSMAVTFAYGLQSGVIKEEDLDRLIDLSLDFDKTFRKILSSDQVVIQFRSEGEIREVAQGNRSDQNLDAYENSDTQRLTREIYLRYKGRIDNWTDVVTRYDTHDDSKWRSREGILEDVLVVLNGSVKDFDKTARIDDTPPLPDKIMPDLVAANQYGIDLGRSNMILLKDSSKNGGKDKSFEIESELGLRIASETNPSLISWDREVSSSINRMLTQYPEVYAILDEFLGREFSETFKQSVTS